MAPRFAGAVRQLVGCFRGGSVQGARRARRTAVGGLVGPEGAERAGHAVLARRVTRFAHARDHRRAALPRFRVLRTGLTLSCIQILVGWARHTVSCARQAPPRVSSEPRIAGTIRERSAPLRRRRVSRAALTRPPVKIRVRRAHARLTLFRIASEARVARAIRARCAPFVGN